jgi:hypothetical protein
MPAERVAMRVVREVLRLTFAGIPPYRYGRHVRERDRRRRGNRSVRREAR